MRFSSSLVRMEFHHHHGAGAKGGRDIRPHQNPPFGLRGGYSPPLVRFTHGCAFFLVGEGIEPSAPPRTAVDTSELPSAHKNEVFAGRTGLSVYFGLPLCCDYSIAQLGRFVNTFLKVFSKKNPHFFSGWDCNGLTYSPTCWVGLEPTALQSFSFS